MTDLETYLKEVKERCEATTEGPWMSKAWQEDRKYYEQEEKDLDFKAHARTDVPRLLDMLTLALSYIKNDGMTLKYKYKVDELLEELTKIAGSEK